MTDFSNAMSVAASGMRAQSGRMRFISENIANADTPGYHRKTTTFEQEVSRAAPEGAVSLGRLRLDQTELDRIYDPAHPMADGSGHYDGSNVDLLVEIADSREASRSYEANLKMFDQVRQMSASLLEILRK
ncbi:flagellar basal body rod protein FlgC [Pseudoroseicyclus aestuarii]|uniref:Flagellar basal body rod protein FlgB n=1 Tax=Pseudoroseicyclus aestuarii TaxID=1795041 RepID=A0A318T861_9RHOB|nr:flagellar basal body rod protein FlgC [Pseudoroseicyclus aestuarii]PYE84578.1 flagellar basal-body rod protein FlgC [Pseudoroseicyclus aestuarii]